MKVIIRQALYPGGQLLQDDYFRTIREILFNKDRNTIKEDTGIFNTKKTVIEVPGLGSNDRGHNSGVGMGLGRDENESSNKTLSSGYNDGEQANDESGPGNTTTQVDPYYGSDVFNELYMDLELKSGNKDSRIKHHLKRTLDGPQMPIRNPRYPVDRF